MQQLDSFTEKRLLRFIEKFREQSGELPTLQRFKEAGFSKEQVDSALKRKLIELFYVTLTNGTIVKTFKISQ